VTSAGSIGSPRISTPIKVVGHDLQTLEICISKECKMAKNYKYSQTHTVGTSLADLGAPPISGIFSDLGFTVVLRNTGTNDCSIYLIGENNAPVEHFLPSGNNGIVLVNVPYEHISNGLQGIASGGSTTVKVTIQSEYKREVNLLDSESSAAVLEQLGIEPSLPGGLTEVRDFRDYFEIKV
jgi:hypothetical protein